MDRMCADVFLLGISLCDDACGGSAGNWESYRVCFCFLLYLYGTPAGTGHHSYGSAYGGIDTAHGKEPGAGCGGISWDYVSVQPDSCHGQGESAACELSGRRVCRNRTCSRVCTDEEFAVSSTGRHRTDHSAVAYRKEKDKNHTCLSVSRSFGLYPVYAGEKRQCPDRGRHECRDKPAGDQ